MDIFEEEEKSFPLINGIGSYRTDFMRGGWKVGNFWYFLALDSLKGLYNIFREHIQEDFAPHNSDFDRIVSAYWTTGVEKVLTAKLQEKEMYEEELLQTFKDVSST
jgi:hypothetical protein